MIGYILVGITTILSAIASYFDLKTTEVPDYISVILGVFGAGFNFAYSYFSGDWSFFMSSIMVGTSFLAFGGALYFMGWWGGADALLVGAIGYCIPYLPSEFSVLSSSVLPFPIVLLSNLFIVGALYSIIFSFYMLSKHKNVCQDIKKQLALRRNRILLFTVVAALILLVLPYFFQLAYGIGYRFFYSFMGVIAVILLYILYIFLNTLDEKILQRRIPVSKLKEGDVLAADVTVSKDKGIGKGKSKAKEVIKARKIVGLTAEQVEKIKKEHKYVHIRQGVCFVPVFPVTVILSVSIGDVLSIILGL